MPMSHSLTPQARKQIVEMYLAGKKTADITKATGAPRSTIYFVLKEEGVRPERKGGRPSTKEGTPLLDWALQRVVALEAENQRLREALAHLDKMDGTA